MTRLMTYRDEQAPCVLTGKQVTLRCSMHGKGKGIIICRGPDNTPKYWKKCKYGALDECPALVVQRGVDAEVKRRVELPSLSALLLIGALARRSGKVPRLEE